MHRDEGICDIRRLNNLVEKCCFVRSFVLFAGN